ncbi:MAG: hypothetical protein L0H84_14145, partial [Pseudonocardia sp.]|nr:hypothetical protein [Pseudonocardia sp.]
MSATATERRRVPWGTAACSAVAVLLVSAPLVAIVQELTWLGAVLSAVLVVLAVGLALHRAGPAVVCFGQLVGVLMLLTGRFTTTGVFGVLPGPAAFAQLGGLQARGRAPVTPPHAAPPPPP